MDAKNSNTPAAHEAVAAENDAQLSAADGATNIAADPHGEDARRRDRRRFVRRGVKLVFVPPLITTFLASEARAAGSNHSCYPAGHTCAVANEPCCPGLVCVPGPNTCQ